MRRKDENKKVQIKDFINSYFSRYSRAPAVRDIATGTGIPVSTVHRYLKTMQESGMITYNGRRNIHTEQMELHRKEQVLPVYRYDANKTDNEEQIIEYIRLPDSLVGSDGGYYAYLFEDNNLSLIGIHQADYVIFKQQTVYDIGSIIDLKCTDHSMIEVAGESSEETEQTVHGLAVCVIHKLNSDRIKSA